MGTGMTYYAYDKMYFMMLSFLYFVIIFLFSVYSYSLVDLNLTLFNHKLWDTFRNFIIQIGYFNRGLSTEFFFSGIVILFALYYLTKKIKPEPIKLALVIGLVSLIAYPFLSHDFFNYMFYGKIVTFYGKNPYLFRALDFPADNWIRFMHWTHNTYPYGPTFLPLTLIPSFLSGGKFILSLFFFKLMFTSFYLSAVWVTSKINKNSALIIATHPLIIIEGLITSHNDLIAMSLGLIGFYLLFNKKNLWSRVLLIISGLIKYTTLPILIISKKNKLLNTMAFIGVIALLAYLTFFGEIQPWYFLSLFIFVPIFPGLFKYIDIFLLGLLCSYYPYIMLGGWDKPEKTIMKHQIIFYFFIANLLTLGVYKIFYLIKKSSAFNSINN
ncbi:MAG: hypothetical protein ACD_12C00600G0004 [uncultured bacterium]|nr:MAG: hypothetical protein ACD_12C00600G0004 [uncultured bacterium]